MAIVDKLIDNTNITSSSIVSSVKFIAGLAIAWAAGKGYISADIDTQGLILAVATLAGVGWTIWEKRQTKQQTVSAIQVGQAMPEVLPESEITKKLNQGQIEVPVKPQEKV